MVGNKNNFDSLESIIKVEPEEFQEITIDDVLRSRANIFSEPIVLLERSTFYEANSNLYQIEIKRGYNYSETSKVLALKGNEGLGSLDPHTCCFCQKLFCTRSSLIQHLEQVHYKASKKTCDLCPKFFFSRPAILHHMKVHKEKCVLCNICDYKTSNKNNFERHKQTHAAEVECPICKKQVTSLPNHLLMHKPKKSCPVCQKAVTWKHMSTHMKTHVKVCKYENCKESFDKQELLRRHKLIEHYDGQLFECHCGSVFKNKYELKGHQTIHSDKVECSVCRNQFSLFRDLAAHWRKNHSRTHGMLGSLKIKVLNRSGPFICDNCGSRLSRRSSFLTHLAIYHSNVSFSCDLCRRSFTRKGLLAIHMEKDHLKNNLFKCHVCLHNASGRQALKVHMLLHGQKTECKICHKLVSNMYLHLRAHVKLKCFICSKIYPKNQKSRHMKAHLNRK